MLTFVILNILISYMVVPSFNVVHIHNKLATRLGICTAINDNEYVNRGHRGHWNNG